MVVLFKTKIKASKIYLNKDFNGESSALHPSGTSASDVVKKENTTFAFYVAKC